MWVDATTEGAGTMTERADKKTEEPGAMTWAAHTKIETGTMIWEADKKTEEGCTKTEIGTTI